MPAAVIRPLPMPDTYRTAILFSLFGAFLRRTQRCARSTMRPIRSCWKDSNRRPYHSASSPSIRVGSIAPSISGTIAPMIKPAPRIPARVC